GGDEPLHRRPVRAALGRLFCRRPRRVAADRAHLHAHAAAADRGTDARRGERLMTRVRSLLAAPGQRGSRLIRAGAGVAAAAVVLAVSAVLTAFSLVEASTSDTPASETGPPLNVAFIWHQHQPLYTDPA